VWWQLQWAVLHVMGGREQRLQKHQYERKTAMKKFATLLALLAVVGIASASDFTDVGYTTEPGIVYGSNTDDCTGTLVYSHDGSFENGLMYWYTGVATPYVGTFGMAYDCTGQNIQCAAFWLTDVGYYAGQTADVYLFEGGISGPPGAVLQVMTGFDPGAPATWPSVSQHDADIPDYVATGEVTIGHWGNWPGAAGGWYMGMDTNGFGGYHWVFTTAGWGQDAGYGEQAWGIGYYFGGTTPAESKTWGAIKALF